jgi:phospholipid N-methyltransferase
MTNNKPIKYQVNGRLLFIQEFLKHPFQIGSIIPSSRFLERRIVEAAEIGSANVIVELGPGTGGVTRAILQAMPQYAKLLSIEINPHFYTLVNSIEDDRLIAHLGSAYNLKEILSKYSLSAPDVVVSGIPFSTMSHNAGSQILEEISTLLSPNGRFIAYQVSNRVAVLVQPFLGAGSTETELLNIPPMRVYRWDKSAAC